MCSEPCAIKHVNNTTRQGGAGLVRTARLTRRAPDHPRGFSLVEIMVVVVIIGLLAGAVTVGFGKYLDSAKQNRAKSDLRAIMTEVDGFKMLNGRYPTNDEGVEVLDMPGGVPTDPWGNRYEYNSPAGNGRPYEVFTLGQDAQEGGDGIDADIYSWQLQQAEETAEP